MDQELMAKALQQVLGAGYESRSRMSGQGTGQKPSPSLAATMDRLVAKNSPSGGDLHVPTTMGAGKVKKKAVLKPVEYVTEVSKVKKPTEEQVAHGLLTAGATGGLLSMPTLVGETSRKMKEANVRGAGRVEAGAERVGRLVPKVLKTPKAGAALAGGAAALETAGLAGDFLGRKVTKKPQPKSGVYKALDRVQDEGELLMETISKADEEKKQVFGWCSISKKDGVDVVDLQGDMIPIEEIETAAYSYMLNSRKGGNQHQRVNKGFVEDEPLHVSDIIESVVFTPEKIEKMGLPADFPQGWWIGQQIHDEETWQQVKTGQRKSFSVHGKGRREPVVLDDGVIDQRTRSALSKRLQPVMVQAEQLGAGLRSVHDGQVVGDSVHAVSLSRSASRDVVDLQAGDLRKAADGARATQDLDGRQPSLGVPVAAAVPGEFSDSLRVRGLPLADLGALPLVDAGGALVPLGPGLRDVHKSAVRAGFRRSHVWNPIAGKGRREPVEKAAQKVQVVYEHDPKAAVRDAALGGAGATAAGAGVSAAALPLAAKRGMIQAEKAEHLSGKFKTVGAIVGGTAGVYGGLHTAHQAAKPQLKAISTKVTVKKPVAKAWSPEARQASIESRRNKRAKTYEAVTATGAATTTAASAGAHLVARRSATQHSEAKARAEAIKVPNNLEARLKVSRGHRNANDRYNAGKGRPVNPKKRAESAARAESKIRANFAEESGRARGAKAVHERAAAKAGGRLKLARRVRGRSGAAALGLGVLTGVIHRERKGSWRSYPGVK